MLLDPSPYQAPRRRKPDWGDVSNTGTRPETRTRRHGAVPARGPAEISPVERPPFVGVGAAVCTGAQAPDPARPQD